jgi:hypothetical protein
MEITIKFILGAVKMTPPCFIPNNDHNENVEIGSLIYQRTSLKSTNYEISSHFSGPIFDHLVLQGL